MKRINFILFIALTAITLCSCSKSHVTGRSIQSSSETNSSDNGSKKDGIVSLEAMSNTQTEANENEPQTFTENFDGIIMTVKTDKSKYQLDELIYVEAAVKNTTNEKIRLFVPVLGTDTHQEIRTGIYGNDGRSLIDVDTFMKCFDDAIDIVTVNPNEEYTQSMVFETYTGDDTSSRKLAEEGLYSGKSKITLRSDPTDCSNGDNYTHYSLDFSLTLGSTSNLQPEQPEISENNPQTFTENFDGIIMTVKTDKSKYQLDELIYVEATVKNTTDEKIYLYASCLNIHSHAQICTSILDNNERFIEIDTFMKDFADAIDIVTINPNEEYTQSTVFETYTGDNTSNRKPAEAGLYPGKSTITLLPDPNNVSPSDFTLHSLVFSLTLE